MEVFCNQELKLDQRKFPSLRIFTLSSSCLTLEFVFGIQCILGFGSDIVEKFFDQNYVASRLKQEADLRSTIQEIRANLSSDC